MKTLGICIGASTISVVGLEDAADKKKIILQESVFHDGDSKGELLKLLKKIDENTIRIDSFDRFAVTGRKFRKFVSLTSITEPEATEYAIDELIDDKDKYNAIVSAGGETIMVYELKGGRIFNVFTGNKCASGTGKFFLQQLGRMALTIDELQDEYSEDDIYEISGRCSVFCKSDCTHALNKGIPKSSVVSGLCKMMSLKITELLSNVKGKNVILVGGISRIKPITKYIEKSVDTLKIVPESGYFEAYGAALWAFSHETDSFPGFDRLVVEGTVSFDHLKPLRDSEHLVKFGTIGFDKAKDGDVCVLGVDIGSTTTKAVLLRQSDNAILAHEYLKTNGDPIGASVQCYKAVLRQIDGAKVKIIGLGTTGSGRNIVGIHALTESIYNEIICHATASVYFDKDVDTIFEIGGQDAKYTYITQGIPSDYAMNEACSAGTGSFLEEAAKEALNVDVRDIGSLALQSVNPPNFNDQCAAFISSDIATAFQEGIDRTDIIAGLVYSICLNYNNRVRGSRPFGKKVFMQGGVCYNRAVPVAMASLLGVEIVVPPEPGLMGAFGCALEVRKRIESGLLKEKEFDLQTLADRKISYGKPFICAGGAEKCDRKCEINIIEFDGKKYPFGGACNRYYNEMHNIKDETGVRDLVALREKMVFGEFAQSCGKAADDAKTIGISRTFLVNMLYPLYFNFWDQLGFKVVLSDNVTVAGREKKKAAFCFPAEIAHGAFDNLLSKNPDYIFMPHVQHIPVHGSVLNNKACVFVQGESYFLKQAFQDRQIPPMLTPIIDFQSHVDSAGKEFAECAKSLGVSAAKAKAAYQYALDKQNAYFAKARQIGQQTIDELKNKPNEFAVVMMGRWYNSLAREANMSIPHKFASRAITVIPFDFIPFEYDNLGLHMHWGIGKIVLQTAKYIKKNPQLFGVYITNFSCGPDSYLVSYFRDEMGKKPSLTLELDSHTADVGLNTRIEAAIDIITYYLQLKLDAVPEPKEFVTAKTVYKGTEVYLQCSDGKEHHIKDKDVTFLYPRMGRYLTEAGVTACVSEGFHAKMVDEPTTDSLNLGKANSSCKECLPYIVLVGSLLDYCRRQRQPGEKIAYFIVGDPSPCRVEQYQVGFDKVIKKHRIEDVAVLTMQSSEGFAGMGLKPTLKVWHGFCIGDVYSQIHSAVLALAQDRDSAMKIVEEEWCKIIDNIRGDEKGVSLEKRLAMAAKRLNEIPLTNTIDKASRITVTGEMYVRNEEFSRKRIENTLADMGFVTRITPLIEWIYYVDYIMMNNIQREKLPFGKRTWFRMKTGVCGSIERKIKKIFAKNAPNLYEYDPIDIKEIIKASEKLIDKKLVGDIGITIGVGLRDALRDSCGIISLGPFACLQTRVAEAILNSNMTVGKKIENYPESVFGADIDKLDKDMPLPYLAIESDGNPYPQLVQARLEVFGLQAKRVSDMMNAAKAK